MKRALLKIVFLTLVLTSVTGVFFGCASTAYPYELDDYIRIPENWENFVVDDAEVSARTIENIREILSNRAVETKLTDQPAAEGHKVNISFNCYLATDFGKEDAVPIKKLSDNDCTMILGKDRYPHELEWGVLGHYVNDRFFVRMTLPKDFGLEEYAVTSVVFDVTLNSITALTLPEYDNSYVMTVSSCKTVSEYEAMMADEARKELLWERIVASAEVLAYPEKELSSYERDFTGYYTAMASSAGKTLEEYVNQKFFITISAFHQEASIYAKDIVKRDLLLYAFLRNYSLELSDSEYQAGAEKYIKQYDMRSLSALEGKFGTEYVRKSVSFDKLLDFIDEVTREKPSLSETPID